MQYLPKHIFFFFAGIAAGIVLMSALQMDIPNTPMVPETDENAAENSGTNFQGGAVRGEVIGLEAGVVVLKEDGTGIVRRGIIRTGVSYFSVPNNADVVRPYAPGDLDIGDRVELWTAVDDMANLIYVVTITEFP